MLKIQHCFRSVLCKLVSCILSINMIFFSVGCKNYYMTEKVPNNNFSEIENLIDPLKPIIVHWYNSTYDLKEVTVDSSSVSGMLSLSDNTFDTRFTTYSWNKVYKKAEKNYINTVHIYLRYSHPKPEPGLIKINSKYISRIDFVKKDAGKTTMSHILGWGGISFFAAIIVALIIDPPVSFSFPSAGL